MTKVNDKRNAERRRDKTSYIRDQRRDIVEHSKLSRDLRSTEPLRLKTKFYISFLSGGGDSVNFVAQFL